MACPDARTAAPQSEARRQHIHGPLVTLAEQARANGHPSLGAGFALLIGLFVIAVGLIVAFGG